jgi:hypothetical protein
MKTRHALIRAAQRGIRQADVELIVRYGTQTSKGVILTRQDFAQAECEAKHLISRLSHLVGKFAAMDGEDVITVFHATECQRRSQMSGGFR